MKCSVCESILAPLFQKKIMFKYDGYYHLCNNCKFIQITNPHWLEEAYSSAITSTDIGLITRNLYFSEIIEKIILKFFKNENAFLDYGGGYGLFVRIMRDKGLEFYREDKYCENLFAKYFDKNDLKSETKFEMVTAFEVFEHLENPIEVFKYLLTMSDNILFSTELQPDKDLENWEYLSPENGQHISLFHYQTLLKISNLLNMQLHTNKKSLHLLTKKRYDFDIIQHIERPKNIITRIMHKIGNIFDTQKIVSKKSLLMQDWELIKSKQKQG